MEQDTGRFRRNILDKYYTTPSIAQHCVKTLLNLRPTLATTLATTRWIEPAVGGGVFLETLLDHYATDATPLLLGIDLEPHVDEGLIAQGIKFHQGNFLSVTPATLQSYFALSSSSSLAESSTVFLGNPPFGRQSVTARAFIRHSASLEANIMAFILPRSFIKPSFQRAFPPHYHLLHSEELPPKSFTVNGRPYDVPCVFQIWEKRQEMRPQTVATPPVGFKYVNSTEQYHLIIRRVGVNAGRAQLPPAQTSPTSHYYLALLDSEIVTETSTLVARINTSVFPTNTVGPRSLSKGEINAVLTPLIAEIKKR